MIGPDGALYAYSHDVYLITDLVSMAKTLAAAPTIYGKVGIRIGWGPGKTELILPLDSDPITFLALQDTVRGGLSHVVLGFSSCLGVPRHVLYDPEFITAFMVNIGVCHGRLLDLVEDMADEDYFAALRLLQMCGV